MNAPMKSPMNPMIATLTLDELVARLDRVTLIEALPAMHFAEGHLPGAINVNHDEIGAKSALLPADRAAGIVVYCASETCMNSHKAAVRLIAQGYTNVAVFGGGKAAWQAAGRALVQS